MATSPLAPVRNKWIFAACWTIWSVVHYAMLVSFEIDWRIAIADSLFSNVLLAGCAILIINTLGYYRPDKKKYAYLLVWCVVLTSIWGVLVRYVLFSFCSRNIPYLVFVSKSMPIRLDITFLVLGCTAIISMLWYNLEEQTQLKSRKSDAEKLSRDAELYKLRQQLQPHFLFNSLNSISALAGKQPEQARKMIQQLSEFLRGALKKEDHQQVTLTDELQHLQLYLDMEQMRFGHRLTTVVHSQKESLLLFLPPMLLQPIVENAIKFGLYDTTEAITIKIDSVVTPDFLQVTVQNPFDSETASPLHGTGFGLSSVKRRLYLLFARNDLLSTKIEGNLFTTTVKIPRNDISDTN
ncbi:MAG: histidine kinase [Flavitalea sp.]